MRAALPYSRILPFACLLVLVLHGCSSVGGLRSRAASQSRQDVAGGANLLAEGRKEEALAAFDRALARTPNDFELTGAVAGILQAEGLYEESIPYIKRAIEVPPSGKTRPELRADKLRDSRLYTVLGDAHGGLERLPEAEDAYRQAVALDKDNATAYNNWGYMYADLGTKLDEALRLTKRAVDMQPNTGEFVDSLGWTYYRMGKAKKATGLLRRAVALSPLDAEIRYHTGMAHEQLGDVDAALIEYRKALLIMPSHKPTLQRVHYLRSKSAEKT